MSVRFIAPALVAAALAFVAPTAQAENVSGITVEGKPTQIRLNVRGMERHAVVKVVNVAARTVCRNAFSNHEIDLGDYPYCARASSTKAMRHFDRMTHGQTQVAVGELFLAVR